MQGEAMTKDEVQTLDASACLARHREIEKLFPGTKDDPSRAAERAALRVELEQIVQRMRELKELQKAENMRRNFAGIGTPLHEAIMAAFDSGTVAKLEADAMARFAERERKSAEKKAAKAEMTPAKDETKPPAAHGPPKPNPPPKTVHKPQRHRPEVIVLRGPSREITDEFTQAQKTPRR